MYQSMTIKWRVGPSRAQGGEKKGEGRRAERSKCENLEGKQRNQRWVKLKVGKTREEV